LRHAVPERIVQRTLPATTSELGSRIDFELKREEIAELLMKHVVEGGCFVSLVISGLRRRVILRSRLKSRFME